MAGCFRWRWTRRCRRWRGLRRRWCNHSGSVDTPTEKRPHDRPRGECSAHNIFKHDPPATSYARGFQRHLPCVTFQQPAHYRPAAYL
eukprot:262686-Chlamydomonas_euryale.AAC.11